MADAGAVDVSVGSGIGASEAETGATVGAAPGARVPPAAKFEVGGFRREKAS